MDEGELPASIRTRLAELRACGNIASVTVTEVCSRFVTVRIVPTGAVAEGGGWEMPTEPHDVRIPTRLH